MTFFLSLDLSELVNALQKDNEHFRDLHSTEIAEIAEIKKILSDRSVSESGTDCKFTIKINNVKIQFS